VKRRVLVLALAAAGVLAVLLAYRAWRSPEAPADLEAARAEHARLRARLEALADADPVVVETLADPASAIVGIRGPLVQEIVEVVASRYLDRVELDLPLDARVHESRDVTVRTFVGPVDAGTWTLDLTVHRVRGRLRARRPTLSSRPGATRLGSTCRWCSRRRGGTPPSASPGTAAPWAGSSAATSR
jgi:hypothetical protein